MRSLRESPSSYVAKYDPELLTVSSNELNVSSLQAPITIQSGWKNLAQALTDENLVLLRNRHPLRCEAIELLSEAAFQGV